MSTVVGKCFICKKDVMAEEVNKIEEGQVHPSAIHFEGWPNGGIAHIAHPGIVEEFEKATKK